MITLDEATHTYTVDGVSKPGRSWSQIARAAGLDTTDYDFPAAINAKHRGKQIHQACAYLLQGLDFDLAQLADESLPFVQAFIDWRLQHRETVTAIEQPLYCAELDLCCTPDFTTASGVWDIKTSDKVYRTWGLQTAAQALASGKPMRSVLWLRPKRLATWAVLRPGHRIYDERDVDVVREACRGEFDGPAITAWKAAR